MQAFLFIDVSSAAGTVYEQPIVAQVKKALPGVAVLDLDTKSDAMLQQYAVRLLQEAEKTVACIKTDEDAAAGYMSIMPVMEELLSPQSDRLLLLYGTNNRLLRMLQARPQLNFHAVANENSLLQLLLLHFRKENYCKGK